MKINAPVRYFGGKGTMYKQILEHFPNEDYQIYIEPFGGSYSVGLHMDYIPPVEIYNDIDNNIFSLFYVLQNKKLFEKFKEKCDLSLYSETFRSLCIEELNRPFTMDDDDIVNRAFEYFYVNRTSRNGIGSFSKNIVVRRNMSKCISDMLSTIDGLYDIHNRMSKVIISHTDGIDLISKYSDNTSAFLYCDPPYHQSTRTRQRYDVDMDDELQEKFIDACIGAKSRIMISGYDCDEYKRLEENGFKKIDFVVHTVDGANNKKDVTESIWINYELGKKYKLETLW